MKWFKYISFFSLSILFSGCIGNDDNSTIENAIRNNFAACEEENVDRYLETVDPESPIYEASKTTAQTLFDLYDLHYVVEDIKIIHQTENNASVEVTSTVTRVSGPAFKNNRTITLNKMVNRDGIWMFNSSQIKKFEEI